MVWWQHDQQQSVGRLQFTAPQAQLGARGNFSSLPAAIHRHSCVLKSRPKLSSTSSCPCDHCTDQDQPPIARRRTNIYTVWSGLAGLVWAGLGWAGWAGLGSVVIEYLDVLRISGFSILSITGDSHVMADRGYTPTVLLTT